MKYYYDEDMRQELIELSDDHIIWKINANLDFEEYNSICETLIREFERKYKNLKVYCCGRSGRHVCVEDTPVNRRRYEYLKEYCHKLQKELVTFFNAE